MSYRYFATLVSLVALAGCAEAPFVDSTPAQLKAGQVVVCWSARHSTSAEVDAVAREACAEGKQVARRVGQDSFACRLFAPRQTTYQCEVEGKE